MLRRFASFLAALWHFITHPFGSLNLTIVRRYADAQGNYIGELYEDGRMIGASCDSWPLDADARPIPMSSKICWTRSFLDPLPKNTLRVGAMEPQDNADMRAHIARRRFLPTRIVVLNRFVEHVLEPRKPA